MDETKETTERIEGMIENELIIITKGLFDAVLKEDKPSDLIALYLFYYYTSKWQKTDTVKAVTNYAAKGLNWSTDRVKKAKKTLIKMGLIEDVRRIDENGKVTGWYVKIYYIFKQQTITQVKESSNQESHPPENTTGGKSHGVEKTPPNALSTSSLNALSTNNINTPKNKPKNKLKQSKEKNKKKKYGECVMLTEKEYDKLIKTYGKNIFDSCIEKLSAYKMAEGKEYTSDYGAIISWVFKAVTGYNPIDYRRKLEAEARREQRMVEERLMYSYR